MKSIARDHSDIVEVGCGHRTNGLLLSHILQAEGSYIELDYSDASVNMAKQALSEFTDDLSVAPEFRKVNAE